MATFTESEIKAAKDASEIMFEVVDKHDRRCVCAICFAWILVDRISRGLIHPESNHLHAEPRRRVGRPIGK